MAYSTDHLVGRQEPRHHAGEEPGDTHQQDEPHCLVARQGSVAHFDQHIDEHPQCSTGAKNSHCQHN